MRPIGILGVAVLAIGLSACSPGSERSGPPFDVPGSPVETTSVDLPKSYKFDPAVISVGAGETVTWTNNDDFPHDVELLDGTDRTLDLPIGGSGEITFDDRADVYYQCSLHPQQMKGRIVVR